jgi:hypothetical protein
MWYVSVSRPAPGLETQNTATPSDEFAGLLAVVHKRGLQTTFCAKPVMKTKMKWKRQLFGVRGPGAALVGRDQVFIASS